MPALPDLDLFPFVAQEEEGAEEEEA